MGGLNTSPTQASFGSKVLQAWHMFSRPRWIWALTIVALVVGAAMEPLIPAMLKPLLDKGFVAGTLDVWAVPGVIVLIFAIRGLAGLIAQAGLAKIATLGVARIRSELFSHMLKADAKLFEQQSASALSNTIIHEIHNGAFQINFAFLSLAKDTLSLTALTGYLLYLNWRLTLMIMLIAPVIAWTMKKVSARLSRINRSLQTAHDDIAYTVEENALAFREIRIFAAQESQSNRFEKQSKNIAGLLMKSTLAVAAITPITQILASIALAAVLTVALIQSSTQGTTVGEFAAFITAMLMIISPLKHLSDVVAPLNKGLISIEKAQRMLSQYHSEQSGSEALQGCSGRIEFKDVSFRYGPDKPWALQHISINIRPGEKIAVVGPSGSGKSTLIQLLCGFIYPEQGEIFIDGKSIRDMNLKSLRQQLAVVSQSVIVLNTSLAENVALGGNIDRERIRACLDTALLTEFLKDLPQGIDTIMGHNASQMSGGQRQRLAIARALYKDAPIIILDEATSALDGESEKTIVTNLDQIFVNRTLIVVSHRFSAIQSAQTIYVLKNGILVEQGNHHDLLAANMTYADLFAIQPDDKN